MNVAQRNLSLLLPWFAAGLLAQAPSSRPSSAEGLPPGAPAAMALIDQKDLLQHATYLASNELGGRRTGSPGQVQAAEYIAKHFEKCGLEPLGDQEKGDEGKRGWFQWYDLLRTSLDPQQTFFTVQTDGKNEQVQSGFAVVPARGGGSKEQPTELILEGGFVFAGKGTFPPKVAWQDKVPLVTFKTPSLGVGVGVEQQFGMAFMSLPRVKAIAEKAAAAGAQAVVVCLTDKKSPLLDVLNYLAVQPGKDTLKPTDENARILGGDMGAQMAAMIVSRIPIVFTAPALSERLLGTVGADAKGGEPGDKQAPGGLRLLIKHEEPAKACNVVAVLRGSDPTLAAQAVVFSAHMDHIGLRMDGEVFNGADDNASGTSGLLEIAQAFGQGQVRPKRSVIFLAVSGEELGLWGSAWFAERPTWPAPKIIANVNTDMIGRSGPESAENEIGMTPSHSHAMFSTIVQDAARHAAAFGLSPVSGDKYYERSDHYNFAKLGIPVVFFCDGEHEDYHQVSDEADKLDGRKMERSARLAFWAGWDVAQADGQPKTLGKQPDWLQEAPRQSAEKPGLPGK